MSTVDQQYAHLIGLVGPAVLSLVLGSLVAVLIFRLAVRALRPTPDDLYCCLCASRPCGWACAHRSCSHDLLYLVDMCSCVVDAEGNGCDDYGQHANGTCLACNQMDSYQPCPAAWIDE